MKHTIIHTMKAAVSALTLMGVSLMAPNSAQAQDRSIIIPTGEINVPDQEAGDIYLAGVKLMGNGDWTGARLKWQAGANVGNPPSMGMLAQTHIMGLGGEKNLERGLDLAERAAALGGNLGKYHLSQAYPTGEGRDVNIALGVQLLRQSTATLPSNTPSSCGRHRSFPSRSCRVTSDEEARRLYEYSADLLSRITDSTNMARKPSCTVAVVRRK